MPARFSAKLSATVLLALISACATHRYQPLGFDADATAQAYSSRSMEAPGLRDFMIAQGHPAADWPVAQWGLAELTLVAFYYHPELALARDQANAARAEAKLAKVGSPLKLGPSLQHHSRQAGGSDSPWSLGLELEIAEDPSDRRAILAERATYGAESAQLYAASVAWELRSRLRTRYLDLYAARASARNLAAEVALRQTQLVLLERRLAAGQIAAGELSAAALQLSAAQGQQARAAIAEQQAQAQLATAIGLPLAALGGRALSFSAFDKLPETPPASQSRREALQNRLDMRRTLLDYAASEAAVKLEVAKQYPSLALRPGYLWDQGDRVWSFAADLLLPALLGNTAGIEVAEARRKTARQQAMAQQAGIINEVERCLASYDLSAAASAAAERSSQLQLARQAQMQKQFDAGHTDRLELSRVRLEGLSSDSEALASRVATQRLLGQLEDALQRPLSGGALPSLVGEGELAESQLAASLSR